MYLIETYDKIMGKEHFIGYYRCLFKVNGENYVATTIRITKNTKKYKYAKTAENMIRKLIYNNCSNFEYKVVCVNE